MRWNGLLDDNTVGIANLPPIIGSTRADITEMSIREFGVEHLEGCMPCMENKGLVTVRYKRSEQVNLLKYSRMRV